MGTETIFTSGSSSSTPKSYNRCIGFITIISLSMNIYHLYISQKSQCESINTDTSTSLLDSLHIHTLNTDHTFANTVQSKHPSNINKTCTCGNTNVNTTINTTNITNCNITNIPKTKIIKNVLIHSKHPDGFGSQYWSRLTCISICIHKQNECNYIMTPIPNTDHGDNGTLLSKFVGFPTYFNESIIKQTKNIFYSCSSKIKTTIWDDLGLRTIRGYYWLTPKPFIKNQTEIAIHIRRDTSNKFVRDRTARGRYLSNNNYIKIIKLLKKYYPYYGITIFSTGKIDDFGDIINENVQFKLNMDIIETYHSLVMAQVLVVAKSTFSWSAAHLNPNDIICTPDMKGPWKRNQVKHWKFIDKDYKYIKSNS